MISSDVWEVLETKQVYSGDPWLSVVLDTVRLPDGRIIADYHRLCMPKTVVVVAATETGQIVVLRSYKHGVRRVCLTLPGGCVNSGENPLEAGRRELLEETGYSGSSWVELGRFVLHSNYHAGEDNFFFARDVLASCEPRSGDLEETEVLTMDAGEVMNRAQSGEFPFLSSVSAIHLAVFRGLVGGKLGQTQ